MTLGLVVLVVQLVGLQHFPRFEGGYDSSSVIVTSISRGQLQHFPRFEGGYDSPGPGPAASTATPGCNTFPVLKGVMTPLQKASPLRRSELQHFPRFEGGYDWAEPLRPALASSQVATLSPF